MKLKKFKTSKKIKKIKYSLVLFIVFALSITIFLRTFSFFSQKQTYDVIKGQVSDYHPLDIKIKSYIDNQYQKTFPKKTDNVFYKQSICTNETPLWDNYLWQLSINNITKPTVCKIYFETESEEKLLKDTILNEEGLNNINNKPTPDFTQIATTQEGLFPYPDDYGTSYYFRGNIQNNNVLFANHYWKIVRINGDDSIRLIFNGNQQIETPQNRSIGLYQFNTEIDTNAYIGYMYGKTFDTLEDIQKNITSNNVKNAVDSWYQTNLSQYNDYLSDTLFCNDRSRIMGSGIKNEGTQYQGFDRVFNTKKPLLKCNQQQDRFTVSDTTIGNGALTYPIALLTADEAMLAGIVRDINNPSNFLTTGFLDQTWTMTPSIFRNGHPTYGNLAIIFSIGGDFGNVESLFKLHIRPVINLKKDTIVNSGNGTKENPYVIK